MVAGSTGTKLNGGRSARADVVLEGTTIGIAGDHRIAAKIGSGQSVIGIRREAIRQHR